MQPSQHTAQALPARADVDPDGALGAAISLWTARFVSSLGLLAAALPARTASRIDPAEVLREG